jgi:hypothetical protein
MTSIFEAEPGRDAIDRVAGLPHRELVRRYIRPMRPVIVSDAISHFGALRRWTPGFFRDRYGSTEVVVDGKTYTMRAYVDALLAATPDEPAPYMRNVLLEQWLPELMGDISPLPRCITPNWLDSRVFPSRESMRTLEIYIGGAGARFPMLHYDGYRTHAWLMQIYGTKRYVVYPPDQAELLYPRGGKEVNKSSIADVEHPDLERFPLFARATPTVFDLHPGETLFVPSRWWHTVKILSPSITISVNSANHANWSAFARDFVESQRSYRSPAKLAALRAYLIAMGLAETAIGELTGWSQML